MKAYMNYIVFVFTVYRVKPKNARPNRKALSIKQFCTPSNDIGTVCRLFFRYRQSNTH